MLTEIGDRLGNAASDDRALTRRQLLCEGFPQQRLSLAVGQEGKEWRPACLPLGSGGPLDRPRGF